MIIPKSKASTVKLYEGEATSGSLAPLLNLHYTTVAAALTTIPGLPKPVRYVGRVRVYDLKEIKNWINSVGGEEQARLIFRETENARRRVTRGEPTRKETKNFNQTLVALLTGKFK